MYCLEQEERNTKFNMELLLGHEDTLYLNEIR